MHTEQVTPSPRYPKAPTSGSRQRTTFKTSGAGVMRSFSACRWRSVPFLFTAIVLFGPLILYLSASRVWTYDAEVSKRSNGSSLAAGDLYGTGIRIGIYLQSIGMFLVSIPGGSKRSGAGVKLAASANMIAILASWTVLVLNRNISPCEAWLVITLMSLLGVAAGLTLYNPELIIGEAWGLTLVCVSQLWAFASAIWFWTTLYRTLPQLGTKGIVWFFTSVEVTGWFRMFCLVMNSVYGAVNAISVGVGLPGYLIMSHATWMAERDDLKWIEVPELVAFAEANDPYRGAQLRKFQARWKKAKETLRIWTPFAWTVSALTFVFTIAGAETIIQKNNLSPQSDLTQPGQLIPLTIGAIIMVDGMLSMVRWWKLRKATTDE